MLMQSRAIVACRSADIACDSFLRNLYTKRDSKNVRLTGKTERDNMLSPRSVVKNASMGYLQSVTFAVKV